MREAFFADHQREFATIAQLQAALDAWVVEYNTERPHQSCGGRLPAERFALAERSTVAVDEPRLPAPRADDSTRQAGVTRWVRARDRISFGQGFPDAWSTFSGEPVEAVVADGRVQILHRGALVATHGQRIRPDQANRGPRAPQSRSSGRRTDATQVRPIGLELSRGIDNR